MEYNKDLIIADIVNDNIKTTDVFKKYGIDFCCGGGISLAKACEKRNVNVGVLISELNNIDKNIFASQNFNNWELDFLVDYIVNTHHAYILEAFSLLDAYSAKVTNVHGEKHPPLREIAQLYNKLKVELVQHMQKEECILFPNIKEMVKAKKANTALKHDYLGTVQNPIKMMHIEHEIAGDILKSIAELTMNYTPPEWACNTFKALYAKLDEFEQDLHLHVHLENNILFPKAIKLEMTLNDLN